MAQTLDTTSIYGADSYIGDSNSSGVSWGAVIAGAFVAAAPALALLALGTGIGLSSISPWSNTGASASAVGWSAIGWLILTELIASSIGGYLAGRLRTRWVGVHTHEVYFRDTAHGFLVWAVGLVIAAAFLTSAASSVVGGAAATGAGFAAGAENSQAGGASGSTGYFADTLLRSSVPASNNSNSSLGSSAAGSSNSTVGSATSGSATSATGSTSGSSQDNSVSRGEVGSIFANGLRQGSLPAADKNYLAQVVAARTGASQADASREVDDTFAQAQQAADAARKATAHAMYWTFLALLVGAFFASFSATVGGRRRDHVTAV